MTSIKTQAQAFIAKKSVKTFLGIAFLGMMFSSCLSAPQEQKEINFVPKAEAIRNSKEALIENLSYPSYKSYFKMGSEYRNSKEYYKAIKAYRKAATYMEEDPRTYNNICVCFIRLGALDLAIENCEKSLEVDPNFNLARNNLEWAELEKLRQRKWLKDNREERKK